MTLSTPYVFGRVEFPDAQDSLSRAISAMESDSKIVAGNKDRKANSAEPFSDNYNILANLAVKSLR